MVVGRRATRCAWDTLPTGCYLAAVAGAAALAYSAEAVHLGTSVSDRAVTDSGALPMPAQPGQIASDGLFLLRNRAMVSTSTTVR